MHTDSYNAAPMYYILAHDMPYFYVKYTPSDYGYRTKNKHKKIIELFQPIWSTNIQVVTNVQLHNVSIWGNTLCTQG